MSRNDILLRLATILITDTYLYGRYVTASKTLGQPCRGVVCFLQNETIGLLSALAYNWGIRIIHFVTSFPPRDGSSHRPLLVMKRLSGAQTSGDSRSNPRRLPRTHALTSKEQEKEARPPLGERASFIHSASDFSQSFSLLACVAL